MFSLKYHCFMNTCDRGNLINTVVNNVNNLWTLAILIKFGHIWHCKGLSVHWLYVDVCFWGGLFYTAISMASGEGSDGQEVWYIWVRWEMLVYSDDNITQVTMHDVVVSEWQIGKDFRHSGYGLTEVSSWHVFKGWR